MKRIFSMLAVLAILFVISVPLFAVPVSATDNDSIVGTWYFNDNINLDSFPSFVVDFTNNGIDYFSMSVYDKNSAVGPRNKYFYYHNANIETTVYYSGSNTWYDETYRTIAITTEPTDSTFIEWLKANATKMNCDGSSCSVADFNIDGVCDTCGNTLARSVEPIFRPNNWPSDLPVVPLGFDFLSRFVVYENNGKTYMWGFDPYVDQLPQVWIFQLSEYGTVEMNAYATDFSRQPVYAVKYELFDGQWYQLSSESSSNVLIFDSEGVNILYSTETIYENDGETPFFPRPLWMEVEMVTKGEVPTLQDKTVGTIIILTLCGVGLVASLVVLSLFGKVFRNYRH